MTTMTTANVVQVVLASARLTSAASSTGSGVSDRVADGEEDGKGAALLDGLASGALDVVGLTDDAGGGGAGLLHDNPNAHIHAIESDHALAIFTGRSISTVEQPAW